MQCQVENSTTLSEAQRRINALEAGVQHQRDLLARLQIDLNNILASDGWRLLTRYYRLRNWVLPFGSQRYELARAALRGVRYLAKPFSKGLREQGRAYQMWIAGNEPGEAELQSQRHQSFPFQPRFSLFVTVRRLSSEFIKPLIESVVAQTYADWELCLCTESFDDSQAERSLHELAKSDPRIRVVCASRGQGTGAAVNAAFTQISGSFIGVVEAGDTLAPFALFEIVKAINQQQDADFIYSDEDCLDESGRRGGFHFKPDWSPDTLRSHNYIGKIFVVERELLETVGGIPPDFDGSETYDLVLRATEQARHIMHIPKILYHRRQQETRSNSGDSPKAANETSRRALQAHMERTGITGTLLDNSTTGTFQVLRSLPANPVISIIIPSKDQHEILSRCLGSVTRSSYPHFEILLVDNNSQKPETFNYYSTISDWPKLRMLTWDHPFNYSAMNNFAAAQARGEVLLLLNNDTEVLSPDWLERMLEHALRPEVGAVGAKLYYPDGTIQHGGVIVGIGGAAGHAHRFLPGLSTGYHKRLVTTQNVSGVTGACLMLRKEVFEEIEGFDERFIVNLNDVDLCMRIRQRGYWVVWTPHAELRHHERKTRGADDTLQKRTRSAGELHLFTSKWWAEMRAGDPFYSPHLTLDAEDLSLRVCH